MSKNLFVTLLIVVCTVALGSLAFVAWKYYQQAKQIPGLTVEQAEQIKYDVGSRFSTENPDYARALQYLSAGNYDEAVAQLKTLQSEYPKGTTERNIIDYSIGVFYAFNPERQREAIDVFKEIVTDPVSYNPTTRALAIEGIGRTYAATHDRALLEHIFEDPYFKGFLNAAKGNYALGMYNLATEGYRTSKTPITSVRLAEKTAADLFGKQYSSDAQKADLVGRFGEYLEAGKKEVDKMTDLPGYNIYRAEFLSIYGGALAYMLLAQVGSYTSGDVEAAYQEAYSLADDGIKPFIILRYGGFLSLVAPDEKSRIEEISARLNSIPPRRRETFDAFLRNLISSGEEDSRDAYKIVEEYRRKSPTFDAYVKQALAR